MPPADFERLLIVGLPRSGTTLLATVLGAQQDVHFLTDYFPAFTEAVQRLDKPWNAELSLSERRIALALVRDQFLRVRHPVLFKPESFASVDELHRLVLGELREHGERWIGHKLLLGPPQLRALLEQTSMHALLLLRDPRDAALSYFHRTGAGVERYVRNWRDTVRVCQELEGHPRLYVLRFEDLVSTPTATLERLGAWLGVGIDTEVPQLTFQRSRAHGATRWNENSAFGDVQARFDAKPLGRWRSSPEVAVVRYAGWCARRELIPLGYEPQTLALSRKEKLSFSCLSVLDRAEQRAHQLLTSAGQRLRRGLVRWSPREGRAAPL